MAIIFCGDKRISISLGMIMVSYRIPDVGEKGNSEKDLTDLADNGTISAEAE